MLTSDQTMNVYRYLGSTVLHRQVNPAIYNAIQAVNAQGDASLEAAIAAELTQLAAIDTKISDSMTRLKFTRVEDVYFNVGAEAAGLLGQGRMHAKRLANLLGCEVLRDIYSTGFTQGGRMKHG